MKKKDLQIGKQYLINKRRNIKGILVKFRKETSGVGFNIEEDNYYLKDDDGLTYFSIKVCLSNFELL